ncbi:MAG: DUF3450 family protein [Kiritimatiellia bacterium]
MALAAAALAQDQASAPALQGVVHEWIELRDVISSEAREWDFQKQWYDAEISMLETEIKNLGKEVNDLRKEMESRSAADAGLLDNIEMLKAQRDAWRPLIDEAEDDLRSWERLLKNRIEFPLPASPALEDRLQRVFSIYAEIENLQHRASSDKSVIELEGAGRRQMDVLYLGLGAAFAVSADDAVSASGEWTDSGWQWTRDDSLSVAVRKALRICDGQEPPAWVLLPLKLQEAGR